MMKDTLKNMNLYINDFGFAGVIDEIQLPKLSLKTDEYRGGGMDAPVEYDLGMEKLETQLTVSKYHKEVLTTFGIKVNNKTKLTIKGSMLDEQNGEEKPVVINAEGRVKEMDFGSWKMGENAPLKLTLNLDYYRLMLDNEEIVEIDIMNLVRKINGVDQLEQTRKNIL
ncbi:phage major tail tube protein [Spartinivicinus ruber]|uniref:phage major tail tube protein n=1 Tax=Spartinivicinus ruber TaxID=2683272 RepID=UPI0013D3F57E|nr:phage major tail tube protein [Spartinivicinus ruber]